jgi:hypothetical protein
MACSVAEAGAAEEAAQILTSQASVDHGIAKPPSRDPPMRAGVCRERTLISRVASIQRFHLGGF